MRLEPFTDPTLTSGLSVAVPDPSDIQRLRLIGESLVSRLFEAGINVESDWLLFFLQVFKMKAVQLAEKLLPAFNTPTGIPWAIVNLKRSVKPSLIWFNLGGN